MFFGPKSPITTSEKVGIETALQKLLDHFGIGHLRDQIGDLRSGTSFGPGAISSEGAVLDLGSHIAGIFDVDASVVQVEFGDVDDWGFETSVRHDAGQVIAYVRRDLLDDPVRVVGHLAASCSTQLMTEICGRHRWEPCEVLRELIAVWHGFGPLMAEASVRTSQFMEGGWDQWSISRQGVLSSTQLGCAMALTTHLVNEPIPAWHRNLHIDAMKAFEQNLKYIRKTGDCLVDADQSCVRWSGEECRSGFRSKFASHRLAALNHYPSSGETLSDAELEDVLVGVNDRDLSVRQHAYRLLEFAMTNPEVVRAIELGLDDCDSGVRYGAIRASGIHGKDIEGLGYLLRRVVENDEQELMEQAAASAAANDLCDDEFMNVILDKLAQSLVRGTGAAASLISVIGYVHHDPQQLVMKHFQTDDDLRQVAEHLFEE